MKFDKLSFPPISHEVMSAMVFLVASVLSRGMGLITTPIFTRIMTPEEIGVVTTFTSWYSLLMSITTLSLTSGGYTIGLNDFSEDRDNYVSSVLMLTSIFAGGFCVVFLFAPTFWKDVFQLSTGLVILMLVGLIFEPAKSLWMARQRFEYKYKLSGVVSVSSAVLSAVLAILAVKGSKDLNCLTASEARLYATHSVSFIVAIIIWVCTFVKGNRPFNVGYWKFSLRLSLPLVGYSIASQILSTSDRIMIDRLVGKREVGIYGIIYTVSSLSLMVWSAVNGSFEPYLYRNIGKKNGRIRRLSSTILILYAIFEIMLVLCAPEIVKILATEEYYEAIYLMPPISAGVFFIAIANMYSDIFVYLKDTKFIMICSGIAAFINISLNYVFINIYGYIAAAYTTLISYIVMALLLIIAVRIKYEQKNRSKFDLYDNRIILSVSTITVVVSMFCALVYDYPILRFLLFIVLVVVALGLWRTMKQQTLN
jgi:O-antigen/teichoic acid export membrane protein